jgi:uncharacterized glyoxalase superfamily protein PhnB
MAVETQSMVIPNVWVEAVEPLRDFYLEKLGFEHMMGVVGKDGKLDFAIVTRDGLMIMMGRPQHALPGAAQGAQRTVEFYLSVVDVDAYYEDLRSRHVRIEEPLQTQWWGDRNFAVVDPYGYKIWFFQTVGEPVPPAGVTMI